MFMFGVAELPVAPDVGSAITKGIIMLGGYTAFVLGGYIFFLFVRRTLKDISKSLGDY